MTTFRASNFLLLICLLINWQTTLFAANNSERQNTAGETKIKDNMPPKTAVTNGNASENEADAEEAEESELNITAERMEMQLEKHQIELSGNVLIEDDTMKLTAQKMTVFLDNDNKMEHIEAEGLVTVRKLDGSESAMGDRGTYDAKNDVIILTGNCTILQGKNAMTGQQVVYDRKNQTINLHGATITLPMKKSDGKGGSSMIGNLFGSDDDNKAADNKKKDSAAEKASDQSNQKTNSAVIQKETGKQ